jgi:hypothetical protein
MNRREFIGTTAVGLVAGKMPVDVVPLPVKDMTYMGSAVCVFPSDDGPYAEWISVNFQPTANEMKPIIASLNKVKLRP